MLIGALGALASLLLFGIVLTLSRASARACDLTQRMTREHDSAVALEQGRRFLEAVIDAMPQGVSVKDESLRWVLANDALCRSFGVERSRLVGNTPEETLAPDVAALVRAQDEAALGANGPVTFEQRAFDAAGHPGVWLLNTKRAVSLPDGSRYIVGVDTDITRLKQAEQALRDTQERLRVINDIAGGMARNLSAAEVTRRAVGALALAFPGMRVSYSSVAPDGRAVVLHSSAGAGLPSLAGIELDLASAPAALEALRREPLLEIEDIRTDARYAPLAGALATDSVRAALEAPLHVGGELSGVVCVDAPQTRNWRCASR